MLNFKPKNRKILAILICFLMLASIISVFQQTAKAQQVYSNDFTINDFSLQQLTPTYTGFEAYVDWSHVTVTDAIDIGFLDASGNYGWKLLIMPSANAVDVLDQYNGAIIASNTLAGITNLTFAYGDSYTFLVEFGNGGMTAYNPHGLPETTNINNTNPLTQALFYSQQNRGASGIAFEVIGAFGSSPVDTASEAFALPNWVGGEHEGIFFSHGSANFTMFLDFSQATFNGYQAITISDNSGWAGWDIIIEQSGDWFLTDYASSETLIEFGSACSNITLIDSGSSLNCSYYSLTGFHSFIITDAQSASIDFINSGNQLTQIYTASNSGCTGTIFGTIQYDIVEDPSPTPTPTPTSTPTPTPTPTSTATPSPTPTATDTWFPHGGSPSEPLLNINIPETLLIAVVALGVFAFLRGGKKGGKK